MKRSLGCAAVLFTFWACSGGDANPVVADDASAGDAALGGQPSLAGAGTEQVGGLPQGFGGTHLEGGATQSEGGATPSMGGAAQPMAGAAAGAEPSLAGQAGLGEGGAAGAAPVGCPAAFTGANCDLPRFELLALPQAATKGVAVGLSANGTVVVGNATTATAQAGFRWTHAGGVVLLDALATQSGSSVTAISADGQVVIGSSGAAAEAVYWPGGKTKPLSLLSAAWTSLQPTQVSADGSVIAGVGTLTGGKLAPFRWTKAGGAVALGTLDATNIAVVGMSSDGTVIAGNSNDAAISGFICKNAALTGLTPLGGDDNTSVLALSADGSTAVGDSLQGTTKSRRVRWLSSTQPVLLDALDAGTATGWGCSGGPFTTCTSMSRDGSVIYTQRSAVAQRWTAARGLEALPLLTSPAKFNCRAYAPELPLLSWIPGNCIGPPIAVIWDDKGKVSRIDDVLATFGVTASELTNATISVVRAVSADGSAILGDNFDTTVVWIARVLR